MEQGLAMTYGDGEGNTVTHYYGGTTDKKKRKKNMANCANKSKPKSKGKGKPKGGY